MEFVEMKTQFGDLTIKSKETETELKAMLTRFGETETKLEEMSTRLADITIMFMDMETLFIENDSDRPNYSYFFDQSIIISI